jgi:hypothetical protein
MSHDYLPTREAELKDWLANASDKITAAPTTYALTAAQATTFSGLVSSFNTAYTAAVNPDTRTKGTILAKNDAMDAVKAYARQLVRIVQAAPAVTDTQRADLGINVHDEPSPINPPEEAPSLTVVSAIGRTMKIKLKGLESEGRGKPDGVAGANLFSFVGETPPAEISEWTFEGGSTRTDFDVEFPASVAAGSQVCLCACWFNPRNQPGPMCAPVSCYIAGGVAAAG